MNILSVNSPEFKEYGRIVENVDFAPLLEELKKTGKQAFVIGIVQALVATLFVDLALLGVHYMMPDKLSLPQLLVLGAIATATAPAATLMVVRQYKAKGPVTDTLLPVVAIDDAVGLVLFAVSFGIAKAMLSGKVDVISVILEPVLEVILSLGLGFVMGAPMFCDEVKVKIGGETVTVRVEGEDEAVAGPAMEEFFKNNL